MGRLKSMRVLLSPLFTVKKSQAGRSAARCRNKKISANVENQVTLDILVKSHDASAFINRSDRACGDEARAALKLASRLYARICVAQSSRLRGKFERTIRLDSLCRNR